MDPLVVGLTGSSWGWSSGSNARSDVGDQVLDINTFEGLGEEAWPVWLDLDVGGLEDGCELLALKAGNRGSVS